jgi:hypothetical protein
MRIKRLVSVVKMATVLEGAYRRVSFCCAFVLCAKALNAKNIHKERFPVYGGKCLSRKWGSQMGGKRFADDEEVETEVRKWLRQQSKDLYATGFDALVKLRDTCINIGGRYVEKSTFLPGSNITYFTFYINL